MFQKILIANRGEIACRIASSARRLGIECVAVYSDADKTAKHVDMCGQAIRLGPGPAHESYLVGEKIIAAAHSTGAQAIHPGYGFLSESATFAAKCVDAGLVFIGPPATAIGAMGNKSAAKALMEQAGVPLVPGYHGPNQAGPHLQREAERIGYPVLIKASAGGGGKGMRIVVQGSEFMEALASCKREAWAAFGDENVLIEKYLDSSRHVEIQIFADALGHCVYLFERDCSIQRRHQKVLEEAPAPGLSSARREAMGQAAVAAARAVGYVGAGTVEFITAQDGSFHFMEMNTRLQVEHAVTEMITGFDLVEWQLRIAYGEPLPIDQSDLRFHGHAFEVRLYAENPERGFLPATGTLLRLRMPDAVEYFSNSAGCIEPAPVRVDSGVREGDAISPFYDPLIAKLIVWGHDRSEALARMHQALTETQIAGTATNVAFLARLVASEAFARGCCDTRFIERNHDVLFPCAIAVPNEVLALAVAWQIGQEQRTEDSDPWGIRDGWRLNLSLRRGIEYQTKFGPAPVFVNYDADGLMLEFAGAAVDLTLLSVQPGHVHIQLGDHILRADACIDGMTLNLFHEGKHFALTQVDRLNEVLAADATEGLLTAPMPGKIVSILAAPGSHVQAGTALMVMEAMKMEHTITAPANGSVGEYRFEVGAQVAEGVQLLSFTIDEPAT